VSRDSWVRSGGTSSVEPLAGALVVDLVAFQHEQAPGRWSGRAGPVVGAELFTRLILLKGAARTQRMLQQAGGAQRALDHGLVAGSAGSWAGAACRRTGPCGPWPTSRGWGWLDKQVLVHGHQAGTGFPWRAWHTVAGDGRHAQLVHQARGHVGRHADVALATAAASVPRRCGSSPE
jgi:hypothetical protein